MSTAYTNTEPQQAPAVVPPRRCPICKKRVAERWCFDHAPVVDKIVNGNRRRYNASGQIVQMQRSNSAAEYESRFSGTPLQATPSAPFTNIVRGRVA